MMCSRSFTAWYQITSLKLVADHPASDLGNPEMK